MKLTAIHIFTFLFFAVYGLTILLAEEAPTSNAREFLVEAILSKDKKRQVEIVDSLWKSEDEIVTEILPKWKRGEVFVYTAKGDNPQPFTLTELGGGEDEDSKRDAISILTGKPLTGADGKTLQFAESELKSARTNSKLRKAMSRTLDYIALSAKDPNLRAESARQFGLKQNSKYLPALEERLEIEKNKKVIEALKEGIALSHLSLGTDAEKLAAVELLGNQKSVPARDFIQKIYTAESEKPEAEQNAAMLEASKTSLRQIEEFMELAQHVGTAFRGLSLGSILLVVAMGLAITFGLMGVINMAHGEIMTLGGYTTYMVQLWFMNMFGSDEVALRYYFIIALPLAFLSSALLGLLLERSVIQFLYKRPLESLLATWGVSMILQQAYRLIFGSQNVPIESPGWLLGNFGIFNITFGYNRLFVIAFAALIVLMTWLLLTKTPLGLYIRAVMQNRQMAACMGVSTTKVNMLTFAFGSGLAGLAGAFLSQIGNVGPNLGQDYIISAFMVVVVGGVGNIFGTVYSAMGIGFIDQALQPVLGPVMGKICVLFAIIIFLQFKPSGLFAARTRSLED